MINFLIDFILYSDKLADLLKEFICGMTYSFSSNITPTFLILDLLFILILSTLTIGNLFGEIEILINSVLFVLRRRLFLNNQTFMLSAHRESSLLMEDW